MKIIDIGICVDNVDPKGIGRVRYRPYGTLVSDSSNAIKYEEWDGNDPFLALPFLPAHINIIPQIGQSIKLIKYDTDKDNQNVEYVGGPYSSPHDLQNQTFTTQHRDTTYGGVIIKNIKDLRNKNGKFNAPTTPEALIKNSDVGFRGNYGSDFIFSENGIQLRGGFLLSKSTNKPSLLDYPQMSKKMGRFSLKKFPKTLIPVEEIVEETKVSVSRLNYIIEYEIDNLTTPTQLKLFVYKIINSYGNLFNTDTFGDNSTFNANDTTKVKLINSGNTLTDATYIKYLDEQTISAAYIELREILYLIDYENLTSLDTTYPDENVYPFYFRPTSNFKSLKPLNEQEKTNKELFLNKVQVRNINNRYGLIYSKASANPPVLITKKTTLISKELNNTGEQSFSNLSADKIYITSTSPNVGPNVKSINFNELDQYELTQENYIKNIEPNTYALVRGENLYNILVSIKKLLDSHIHNINEPLVQTDPNWIELNNLMETLRNDLMNDSIRIN